MNISPTLTKDEFKDIHNAKCEVNSVLQTLDGVIHPDMQKRLASAVEKINRALKNAYAEDYSMNERRLSHYNAISEQHDFKTVWSVSTIDDLNAEHPFKNATQLRYEDHWGADDITVSIEGNTWVDLWRAAEKAISESGDNHHIFIEDFKVAQSWPWNLILTTGS